MFDSVISPLAKEIHRSRRFSRGPVPPSCPDRPARRRWIRDRTHATLAVLALLAPVLTPLLAAPAVAKDELTLRIDDVKGAPGELVAVEVRTYAPRGVGQGQICLSAASRLDSSGSGSFDSGSELGFGIDVELLSEGSEIRRSEGAARSTGRELAAASAPRSLAREAYDSMDTRPLIALEGVAVLSGLGDAVSGSFFDAGTQTADVEFSSASATINEADGPMVIFYFRLGEDLQPDQEYYLALDPEETFIVDASGNQVPLELRGGRLRIEAPKAAPCD